MTASPAEAAALRTALNAGDADRKVRILPGLSLCLADTRARARALAEDTGDSPAHVRHWSIVGTPQDAVDAILRWHGTGAIDGFIALPTGSWRSLELFCREVVPELAAAGAFRTHYSATTLRGHLQENR